MKHASRISTQALQVRIRRLGFNPDHLTAAEQEELIAIEETLSAQQEQTPAPPQRGGRQRLLVSP
jgi:hypothetical protein